VRNLTKPKKEKPMKIEFTSALFEKPQGENKSSEDQSGGLLLYSKERYGSVQAFITHHAADFARFKKEFEDEIDRVKKFVEDHSQADGGHSSGPHFSPEMKLTIVSKLEAFKPRLFGVDNAGGNQAYRSSAAIVYSTGKTSFFSFSKLLHNQEIPLQKRLDSLANLAHALTVCGPGLINDLESQLINLMGAFGLKGLVSELTQRIAKQEIVQFANARHPHSHEIMETHVVQYYSNRLAQPAKWLPWPFTWPVISDEYATAGATKVSETDLKDCYAILKEKIKPSLIVRQAAEDYLKAAKDHVMQAPTQEPIWKKLELAQDLLKQQYGEIQPNSVMDDATFELLPNSMLIAVEMLKDLKEKKLIAGDGPKVLDRKTPRGEELPYDLMQWEQLFWVREWAKDPQEENANISADLLDKHSGASLLGIEHLDWFSPEDVEASLSDLEKKEAARVLNAAMREAAASADVNDMLAIPDAWLRRMSIDEMLRTMSPDDPKRKASAEEWAAFFKKAVAEGVNIEERNDRGQTLLLTAAEAGMVNTFVALLRVGANVRVKDRDGQKPLLLAVKNAPRDMTVEQWAAFFKGAGVKGSTLEESDPQGHTLLLTAAQEGLVNAFTALAEAGANLRARNRQGQNALRLSVARRHDEMATAIIARLRSSGRYDKDLLASLNIMSSEPSSQLYDNALRNNCPKTVAAINEFIIEAIEKRLLKHDSFRQFAIDSIDGRCIAYANGYLDTVKATNALLIWVMEQNRLEKEVLHQVIAGKDEHGLPPRYLAASKDHAEMIRADNEFLIQVMENDWLDKEMFLHIVGARNFIGNPARFAALATNSHAAIEADNDLLIKAMKEGWVDKAKFEAIAAARSNVSASAPGRYLALSRGYTAAIEADNKLLIEAMKNDWLSKKAFIEVVTASYRGVSARTLGLSRGEAAAIEADNKLLIHALKEGWLNEAAFAKIAGAKSPEGYPPRGHALQNGHAAALRADNKLLAEAMKNDWLSKEKFLQILIDSVPGFQSALKDGHAEVIEEHNNLLREAMKMGWLTTEELREIVLSDALDRQLALAGGGAAALKADYEFLYEATNTNNGWLTPEDVAKAIVNASQGRQAALANGCGEALEEHDKRLIQARKDEWLTKDEFEEALTADPHGAQGRPTALENGHTAAIKADYEVLLDAVKNGSLSKKKFQEIVIGVGPSRKAALANNHAEALQEHNKLLREAMAMNCLSKEELREIVFNSATEHETALAVGNAAALKADYEFLCEALNKEWLTPAEVGKILINSSAGRKAALANNHAEALQEHNKLLLEAMAMKCLSKEELREIVLNSATEHETALAGGNAAVLKADYEFLCEALNKEWLTPTEVGKILTNCSAGREVALASGHAEALQEHNKLLREAMAMNFLSKEELREIVLNSAAEHEAALAGGPTAALKADYEFLFEAIHKNWLGPEEAAKILINSSAGRQAALANGHSEAIEEFDKRLAEATRNKWLTREAFEKAVIADPDGAGNRLAALEAGHAAALKADYETLIEAVKNELLSKEKFRDIVITTIPGRQAALANGHGEAVRAHNELLVEGMQNGWLNQADIEKKVFAVDPNGVSGRNAALEHGHAAAIQADNRLISKAMARKWLPSEKLEEIMIAAIPAARAALAKGHAHALKEHHNVLLAAVKYDWLSKNAAGKIVIASSIADYEALIEGMDNEWRASWKPRESAFSNIFGRQTALANGKVGAIQWHNELLSRATQYEWLTPEELKDILIKSSAGREAALVKGFPTTIRADNVFLVLARKKNWLDNEDLKTLFAAGDAKTFRGVWPFENPLSRKQDKALRARGEAILECYKNGWFSQKDLQDLEPERGWLQKTFPVEYKAAEAARQKPVVDAPQIENDRTFPPNGASADVDLRGEEQLHAVFEEEQEGPVAVQEDRSLLAEEDDSQEREEHMGVAAEDPLVQGARAILQDQGGPTSTSLAQLEPSASGERSAGVYAPPRLLAQHPIARQGAFAGEMEALGLELTIYGSAGKLVRDAVGAFNDCSLHTLFRVDRALQSAYLRKDADPEGWKDSLNNLAEQLELSAGTDQITFGGITGEHLIRLFEMRSVECQGAEELVAGVEPREFADVVKESHKEGKTIVLLTDGAANVGGRYVSGRHFVTLVPPHKPHETPDAPRPEDPAQQIWRISDSIPDDDGAPQYAEVRTRDILQAFEGTNINFICVPNGPTHHEQMEQARNMERELQASRPSLSISTMTETDRLYGVCVLQFQENIIAELAACHPELADEISAAKAEAKTIFAETIPAPIPDYISNVGKLFANVINSLAMGDRDDALAHANIPHPSSAETKRRFPTLSGYLAEQEPWGTHMKQIYPDSFAKEQKQAERKLNAAKGTYEKGAAEGELHDKNKAEWEQAAEAAKEENVQKRVTANLTSAFIKTRSVLDQAGEKNYDLLLDLSDARLPRSKTFFLEATSAPIHKDGVYCLKVEGVENDGKQIFIGLSGDALKGHFIQKPDAIGPGDRFEARITKDVCSLTASRRNKGKNLLR
jgi:hypothetical protein